MRHKIFCGDDLHTRFTALLSTASAVDIATAWATPGEHLRALHAAANRGVKVRAIVGISGNATHPDALEELSSITAADSGPCRSVIPFHADHRFRCMPITDSRACRSPWSERVGALENLL